MYAPGHVGIRGNKAVDKAAKEALDQKKTTTALMPFSDLKTFNCQLCISNLAETIG